MSSICSGDHFSCGETALWKTGVSTTAAQKHTRNKKVTFMLGATEIIVNKETRTFSISFNNTGTFAVDFLIRNDVGGLVACGTPSSSGGISHAVSENYKCVSTTVYFLDTRYNNAICKEVTETLYFSESGGATVGFQETWGTFYYPKFKITNLLLTTSTDYFVVINGAKTILKTMTASEVVNGDTNPLILVWPNPPSLATTTDADIVKYGFYDYYGEGQPKIEEDGGDDFYYTDWMRLIGGPGQAERKQDAELRYYNYYLSASPRAANGSLTNPGIFVDPTPIGSIAQDTLGNVFYSMLLGGIDFNSLTNGDLLKLFPTLGANPRFYPISII